jgi:hypothetical protein
MNNEQLIIEIKADIKKQKEIYNSKNSTTEQQQRAYIKKQELLKELKEIESR